jgi:hypothetical protein
VLARIAGHKGERIEAVVLRSDPALLVRRNQPAQEPAVVEKVVEEGEAPTELPAPKPHRRKKAAA